METLKKRLYFFVPYNISPIQQGIQAGHAALEYASFFRDYPEYMDFIKNHKTWIILNGGTTNSSVDSEGRALGSLDQIVQDLGYSGVYHASFYEPDLNYALTAVCFLADERVWDWENYPHWDEYINDKKWEHANSGQWNCVIWPEEPTDEYIEMVGGRQNFFLKNLIKGKRLA